MLPSCLVTDTAGHKGRVLLCDTPANAGIEHFCSYRFVFITPLLFYITSYSRTTRQKPSQWLPSVAPLSGSPFPQTGHRYHQIERANETTARLFCFTDLICLLNTSGFRISENPPSQSVAQSHAAKLSLSSSFPWSSKLSEIPCAHRSCSLLDQEIQACF